MCLNTLIQNQMKSLRRGVSNIIVTLTLEQCRTFLKQKDTE